MSTDVHGARGADAPPTPHPDSLPDPDDGSNPLPVPMPPYYDDRAAAATALLPAVVDEEATEPASPDPTLPEPPAEPEQPVCVVGPLAAVGDLCRWLAEAAARNGHPTSVSLSAPGREATVHFGDAETFNAWCDWYGVGGLRYTRDLLGESAEGTIAISGWVLRVRLSGPAVEELS